jgi:uncharacterized protein GlcG (DUF336 family)
MVRLTTQLATHDIEDSMNPLTLKVANKILEAALDAARQKGYPPLAVVVLDEAGNVRAVQREDGASMFRVDVATGKAWAAAGMGASSRTVSERAKSNPNFFVSLAATAHGKFLPQTGAVVVKNSAGEVIGAVGASGGTGDEDEAACIVGIEAAGLRYG